MSAVVKRKPRGQGHNIVYRVLCSLEGVPIMTFHLGMNLMLALKLICCSQEQDLVATQGCCVMWFTKELRGRSYHPNIRGGGSGVLHKAA